ncbi:MAG: S9 family peptidase, partial [Firmicutes bacterium]|nr:S9 family peptidase [Bacillota bacterium]
PMMEMSETAWLDKATLAVQKRSVKQGPVTIDVNFKDGKASGTMTMNGNAKPIAGEVGGDVFADGAGDDAAIAALPLAPGYTATFRTFDLMKQKAALKQAKVVGMEEVQVPGGSAKAWKVEVTSADGAPGSRTLWIAQDSRKVLKTSATVPELGGAVLTTELQ